VTNVESRLTGLTTARILQYYRCPERVIRFTTGGRSGKNGYFLFGPDVLCYGRVDQIEPSDSPGGRLPDVLSRATTNGNTHLPFDPAEVIDNLRLERYTEKSRDNRSRLEALLHVAYYFVRPILPVAVRKHLQKARLANWNGLDFPRWPVDRTVDRMFEQLLLISLRAQGLDRIPFIWFWPDGAPSCAIMTHDVETTRGRDFTEAVMNLDDEYKIKACFSIVPERRYEVTGKYLDMIRARGFEVIVQDLNHDGHLFRDRAEYLTRVARINAYGAQFGATGFRAAVLYRKQEWFDSLAFSYDTSVPNVAHLEPQRGGCCTVMPYFVGDILELPVTTTQDYALFNYLNQYSIDLWARQIELIMEQHGLSTFIVHPDYLIGAREQGVYRSLLSRLTHLRDERSLWIPTPGEAARWWRRRATMGLVEDGDRVRIEGEGSERARVAYASERDGRLVYEIER
jgi:hypothetical protein